MLYCLLHVGQGDKGVSWTASLSLQGAVGALPECRQKKRGEYLSAEMEETGKAGTPI